MSKAEAMRGKRYYQLAQKGSSEFAHPAMKALTRSIKQSDRVLDVGCGEGTRLAGIVQKTGIKNACGTDANTLAMKLAQKRYPMLSFTQANAELLPYKKDTFDLTYSAYVFEHLTNPKQVFAEMIRVTKPGGTVVVIAPNFGAPNRRSPNSIEPKITKLLKGFVRDFVKRDLDWTAVTPQENEYEMDRDTTVEPYLLSLIQYAKAQGLSVLKYSSCWSQDRWTAFQALFRVLGSIGVFPFKFWGPHLFIVASKK